MGPVISKYWREVYTPALDHILTDQQYSTKAMFWVFALFGRMFFDVASNDDWQVALFIRGVAGSGKSTLLKIMTRFYTNEDVGLLMSDGQSTFSDEHLLQAKIVLAMDVDATISFSQVRFNSFVSGEYVSVARKFKTAINVKWTAPMCFASNCQVVYHSLFMLTGRFLMILFLYVATVHGQVWFLDATLCHLLIRADCANGPDDVDPH
jgi:hypothetical protein